nr:palmitoyltransferase akr1-like isoform X2 [Procambarus clarkii]
MAAMTASVLNNFADLALSLPTPSLEATIKQNPTVVDSTGYDGRTALQKAVMVGNLPVVRLLLQYGADPNLRAQSGETAVHIACCRGLLNVVVTLLKHGGDPMVVDGTGKVAAHCAAIAGSMVLVQYLAEVCEVNLEAEDNRGSTPLHIAAACGHLGLVQYLVQSKNSPDCRKWLDRWTRQYERSSAVESPRWPWLIQLLTPVTIFYIGILLSMFAMPHHQWMVGLPVFIVALTVLARQQHRMKHPIRWPNPIYLGAYGGGLLSTMACYFIGIDAHRHEPIIVSLIMWSTALFHVIIFYKLVTGDPGIVRAEGPLQEVLRGVGEGVVRGYCSECQLASPPFSHHCRLCVECHHQTDHHCLFLNTCIAANNHWHFVVFIMSNMVLMVGFLEAAYRVTIPQATQGDWVDQLAAHFWYLMDEDMWTFLMMICNGVSLLWAIHLLNNQFQVIGSQQTTLCRLKLGNPLTKPTHREKVKNFWSFLVRGRVPLSNQTHYFSQV